MPVNPVFFDESGRRWRIIRCLLVALLLVLVSLPATFLLSALTIHGVPQVFEKPTSLTTDSTGPLVQFGHVASKYRTR
jgi:hypothetical protein